MGPEHLCDKADIDLSTLGFEHLSQTQLTIEDILGLHLQVEVFCLRMKIKF